MSETAARQSETASPSPLHLVERDVEAPALGTPQATAWAVLFGALSCAAGHGLFLSFALTQLERIPNVAELGGLPNALVVSWFAASIPASVVVFVRRRQLASWPVSRLRRVAYAVAALTAVMFVLYVRKMVIG